MLWFALFFSFSLSWMLVIPVLAAIFHLLRLGQAVTSTTALASLLTTKCKEVSLQARSSGGTVTMVRNLGPSSVFSWSLLLPRRPPNVGRYPFAYGPLGLELLNFPSWHFFQSSPEGAGIFISRL